MEHKSDAELMELVHQKNRAALEALYDRYVRLVYSFAFKATGDEQATRAVKLASRPEAAVRVLAPAQGDVLYTDTVKVAVAVFHHRLTDFRTSAQPVPGEGHVHIWLDSDPSDPKLAYKLISGEPAVFDHLAPGTHTLTVQLVGNDHKPIAPEAKQVITFTTAQTPALSVTGVREGGTVTGDKVTVNVNVSHFALVDFRAHGMPMPGQGHVHLWLDTDVTNPKIAAKLVKPGAYTFDRVKPGKHTLTVQLVGNDHQPIRPLVKQVIHFTTTAAPAVHKPAPQPAPAPAKPAAKPKPYTVSIQNFSFQPGQLTIEAGSTVTFTNLDEVGHTVTAKDGSFDSGLLTKGKSCTVTFAKPGVYQIYCKPHHFMVGTITVK